MKYIYTVVKIIKNIKNAIFTRYKILREKRKNLKPKIQNRQLYGTALNEVQITYTRFA